MENSFLLFPGVKVIGIQDFKKIICSFKVGGEKRLVLYNSNTKNVTEDLRD